MKTAKEMGGIEWQIHAKEMDKFYSQGGWKYYKRKERKRLKKLIDPLRLKKGLKLLEIGCGMGMHANILAEMELNSL